MIRITRLALILVLTAWMVVGLALPASLGKPVAAIAQGLAPSTSTDVSLMQFASGGHILGFHASGVYIASTDHVLRINFVGVNQVQPDAEQPTKERQTDVPEGKAQPLGKVTWRGLWDGISVTYQAAPGGVAESVYQVEPGASPESIRLSYNVPATLNSDGSLKLAFEDGNVRESAPVAWQVIGGQRVPVQVAFRMDNQQSATAGQTNEIGFALGKYDSSYPLVIDPTLTWNTFLGGALEYVGNAIAIDSSNNIYVAGKRSVTWKAPDGSNLYQHDILVAKLAASGIRLWNVSLGGPNDDLVHGIAVSDSGTLFLTGESMASWGSPVHAFSANVDNAFVAALDTSNGDLLWNTFLAGNQNAIGWAVDLDPSGNIYITGESYATWGAPILIHNGGDDAFVARLSPTTGVLEWNTFFGSSGYDRGAGIVVSGLSVYVTGESYASWGLPIRGYQGGKDAFVARLSLTGTFQWNTFLGGLGSDGGSSLVSDASGNISVAGTSDATWGAPARAYSGDLDNFAARLSSGGVLQWMTFIGGTMTDFQRGIAVDGAGNVYLSGYSVAPWGSPLEAGSNTFAAKLSSSNGSLLWNTFLGGLNRPDIYSNDIIADSAGNIVITGSSSLSWGSPTTKFVAGIDAFAAKLDTNGAVQWNTFIGESEDDDIASITTDTNGMIYVIGNSWAGWGSPVRAYSGSIDTFIAKLKPDGSLAWLTYLGGLGADTGGAIMVDTNARLYVTGKSDASWGSPVRKYINGYDVFIARLDAITGALIWNTFIGGSANDYDDGITWYSGGQLALVGESRGSWGNPLRAYAGGSDAFVAGIDANSGALKWNTFLGGTGNDVGWALLLDPTGKLYILGSSNASWGSPKSPYQADIDVFLAELSPSAGFQWNTFLGGSGYDRSTTMVWDENGHLVLAGVSDDTWGSPKNPFQGAKDAFVASLDTNGSILWNTFMGSPTSADYGMFILSDGNGSVYVSGQSQGESWGAPVMPYNGEDDVFLAKVDEGSGILQWNGFVGGSDDDSPSGIALEADGSLLVAGSSYAEWTAPGVTNSNFTGGLIDSFVARISLNTTIYLPMLMR